MRSSLHWTLPFALLIASVTPSTRAQPPRELQGRWKLQGNNRLLGALEVRDNGTYTYAVLPNYRETGTLTLDVNRNPRWINLSITEGPHKGKVTLGIYRVDGSKFQLCLGKLDGPRPTQFHSDPDRGVILWEGSKE
jgi:uncharacterized protein (TIGR03067 family)